MACDKNYDSSRDRHVEGVMENVPAIEVEFACVGPAGV